MTVCVEHRHADQDLHSATEANPSGGWVVSTLRLAVLVPRNAIIALLKVYRLVVSPLYGDVCRYYPSCSAYSLGSVQVHGVVKGSWLTARRLVRCHPWSEGGIDDPPTQENSPYRVTRFGFVTLRRKA